MRPLSSLWACLLLLAIALFRAWQIYRSSTIDLRPTVIHDDLYRGNVEPVAGDDRLNARILKAEEDSVVMGAEPSNLFFFLQVSDLHISKYEKKGHTAHFLHFLQSILPIVRPEFAVVTGDLTDAKYIDKIKTEQYPEEWDIYRAAVEEVVQIPWYDMRGNHDCFNLPSWESQFNLYQTHGKSADLVKEGQGVYSWNVEKPFGQYKFVAVDACPKKGPARPINFFGYLTSKMMDRLVSVILPSSQYNHTFMLSHYPTTTMVSGTSSQGYTYKDLAKHISAYLCGHLHRLVAGLGDVLKSYDRDTDSLELELADLKDHGAYRIVAVDHDLISFVDVELPLKEIEALPHNQPALHDGQKIQWPTKIRAAPIVLITNPKDARFILGTKEPYHRPRKSSHIRFLVFSEDSPSDLRVSITVDEKRHPFRAEYVGTDQLPLWVSAWEPNDFDDLETHTLRVSVTDANGQIGEAAVVFRMDDARVKIGGGIGEWIISTHMASLLRTITLLAVGVMLVLLLAPKIYDEYTRRAVNGNRRTPALPDRILLNIHDIDQCPTGGPIQFTQRQVLVWALRFLQFPNDQPIVWMVTFCYTLALIALPWFHAEFIPAATSPDERYGTFYVWGLMFGQQWVPLADTWKFACVQVCMNVGVFLLLFAWRSTHAADLHCTGSEKRGKKQLSDQAWFKGAEILYWLWRVSEVAALASFYGGVWPTLIMNSLMLWLVFAGAALVWGKQGLLRKRERQRVGVLLDGCPWCQKVIHLGRVENEVVVPVRDQSQTVTMSPAGTVLAAESDYLQPGTSTSDGGEGSRSPPRKSNPKQD